MSSPFATASTRSIGSIRGSNSGRSRTVPSRVMQWRILKSRSAMVSQYASSFSLGGRQKYGVRGSAPSVPRPPLAAPVICVNGSRVSRSTCALESRSSFARSVW
jgi:hypothetical protein